MHCKMQMTTSYITYPLLLITLLGFSPILAVRYEALNDAKQYPGGVRFEHEIGIPYTLEIMKKINHFIWDMFQQRTDADRKPVPMVKVFITQFNGAEAVTFGDFVNVSAIYLQGYQGNLKWEYTSLLHHELTHVFQWNGEGKAPVGLVEGIADYTILKANYYPPAFAKHGQGDRWDQGYDFTARFLEYCDGLKPGFVAALNKMMRSTYSDDFFKHLLGKPVNQLWEEYKAHYGHKVVVH